MASAAAKSRRSRAAWRCSRRAAGSSADPFPMRLQLQLGLALAQDLLALLVLGVEADQDPAAVDLGHLALGGEGLAGLDHGREPDLQSLDRGRVADPAGDHAGGDAHGVHAVGDHPGQPDGLGDLVVPVDRVEVAGGAGVADQVHALDRLGDLGEGVAGPHAGQVDPGAHARPSRGGAVPRDSRVPRTRQTGSPSSVLTSVSRVSSSWRPLAWAAATLPVASSRWPARSDSTTAKVGTAGMSGWPAARAAASSW